MKRILALIPKNLHILDIENPFDLFRVKGFKAPKGASLAQASWALLKAKQEYGRRRA